MQVIGLSSPRALDPYIINMVSDSMVSVSICTEYHKNKNNMAPQTDDLKLQCA